MPEAAWQIFRMDSHKLTHKIMAELAQEIAARVMARKSAKTSWTVLSPFITQDLFHCTPRKMSFEAGTVVRVPCQRASHELHGREQALSIQRATNRVGGNVHGIESSASLDRRRRKQ